MFEKGAPIAEPKGKLGVLLVGMGAVTTTFIAGVEALRKGLAKPIGSLTQMGTIRLGKRTEGRSPLIKDFVPLAGIDDLVFGAWDIFEENCYDAAMQAGVIEKELLVQLKSQLSKIKPMPAVFEQDYVKRLSGTHIKKGKTKMDMARQLMEDIAQFKKKNRCSTLSKRRCAKTIRPLRHR
jgi:myo-inositol-1-phosphate synthase